jgi:hypothetical protein
MTEAEWLTCCDVARMLCHLRQEARVTRFPKGRRKLQLLACGCCRQVWELIEDRRSRRLVELVERLADPAELAAAEEAARAAKLAADAASARLSSLTHVRKVGAAISAALRTAAKDFYKAARTSSGGALCSVGGFWCIDEPNPAWEAQERRQANLLRCLFGSPIGFSSRAAGSARRRPPNGSPATPSRWQTTSRRR